jgi:chromosome segregation ATPase
MNDQVSTDDILEAINTSSSEMQKKFDSIDGRLDSIDSRIDSIDGRLDSIDGRIDSFDSRIDSIEGRIATKQDIREFQLHIIDKMSEGFADIEGTMVSRQRKEDQKVNLILDLLERHKVAPTEEIEHVRSIRLFPQVVE